MLITRIEQIREESEHKKIDPARITTDLFGDPLDKSQPLWTVSKTSKVMTYLRAMLDTVSTVLKRQYRTYLELSEEDKDMMARKTG